MCFILFFFFTQHIGRPFVFNDVILCLNIDDGDDDYDDDDDDDDDEAVAEIYM